MSVFKSMLSLCLMTMMFANANGQESSESESPQSKTESSKPAAMIDGDGPDWKVLGESDFQNVNCKEDTWKWNEDGSLSCSGNCVGVLRSKESYTNLELLLEWKHLQSAGNSGVFVWSPLSSLESLKPNSLPEGIECQVLDHGYKTQYEKGGKKGDWFSTNGDVFPVGKSKMKPFPPLSPNGVRSFPTGNHSLGFGEWNHYYIRAINGEVRLWVNGHEVSGGNGCEPATGYIALEAEGAPIEFRNLKIRVLP